MCPQSALSHWSKQEHTKTQCVIPKYAKQGTAFSWNPTLILRWCSGSTTVQSSHTIVGVSYHMSLRAIMEKKMERLKKSPPLQSLLNGGPSGSSLSLLGTPDKSISAFHLFHPIDKRPASDLLWQPFKPQFISALKINACKQQHISRAVKVEKTEPRELHNKHVREGETRPKRLNLTGCTSFNAPMWPGKLGHAVLVKQCTKAFMSKDKYESARRINVK